ncbi:uncharacterized protein BO66DRAFT_428036 [Aspergillus aculeatinus CBS 121060]|uniref:Uncharacterized protein n=1 Tax=Aspergillus aculeatinus CBS 121060 TaxID=1448322 RepID=A0ACD1HDH6_9EURO|nr:hypothetical protein BO66DRAFT_428036 [Aspergillus aculeatinus CBS 121060]RAH71453.1 hypothetical protein BO66DRAFT_428036 [Aspergillus aculeatinus CBS 121060]
MVKTPSQTSREEPAAQPEPRYRGHYDNQDGPGFSAEDIPEDWTNDPKLLEFYDDPKCQDADLARCCRIQDPRMVLMGTPESGEMQYIIASKGKYYWGHFELLHLEEITRPKTLSEIVHALRDKGFRGLRMKTLKPVWTPEDEEDARSATSEGPNLFVPVDPDAP